MTSFLSVPYILDMLGATEEGLAELARLDLVSTGGSPLPPAIGDTFCKHGIKLVSRYGSSECGCESSSLVCVSLAYLGVKVLMTSFRDFENDKDWSHLRTTEASRKWLNFEDQGDGSAELIVPEAWPTRVRAPL
jgi:acyl-coenzyme A synthetase/AMP-(fatty) acid ligase